MKNLSCIDFKNKFKIGDYVITMYQGQYVYGTVCHYINDKISPHYEIKLNDGRKILIFSSTYCVKTNAVIY